MTDGEQRASLAVVRSLGRAGYRVWVGSGTGRSLAGASRYAAGDFALPDVLAAPVTWAHKVDDLCRRLGITVLIPMTEASLTAVLSTPPSSTPTIPFPDLDRFARISDKEQVLRVAPEVGISVPAQRIARSPEEVRSLHPRDLKFPLVIKPARSVTQEGDHQIKLSVLHANTEAEFVRAISELPRSAYPLLLQQRVVGPGVGIFLLSWQGRIAAQFAHRRIREKPPSGGVSVYRESIAASPELVARSRALLQRFGWEGVAMIEYKVEATTGICYLMEVNGRFWGSLQLAIDSGVDFPRLLVETALGASPAPVLEYRTGVRSRWWWGDFDHLLARIRRSPAELGLPSGAPSRFRAMLDFLRLWRPGDRSEIWRWSDPGPFFRETSLWLRGK